MALQHSVNPPDPTYLKLSNLWLETKVLEEYLICILFISLTDKNI